MMGRYGRLMLLAQLSSSTICDNMATCWSPRRIIMAKGQQRKNKETKKPKQSKEVVVPAGFIIPSKPSMPQKNKH